MPRVAIFAVATLCAASVHGSVLDSLSRNDLRIATRLREIDPSAVDALKRHFSDDDRRLADRGAGFEGTDAIGPENFPQRRLVLAARAGDTWFIHYEHGGRGYHSHLVALTRSDHSWRLAYAATAFYTYDTLPKLRAAIRKRKFDNTYDL
jgi:hypothetical protein